MLMREAAYTILMKAAENGNPDIVNALIDAGADVHIQTSFGRTAVNFAERAGYHSIAETIFRTQELQVQKMCGCVDSKCNLRPLKNDKGDIIDYECVYSSAWRRHMKNLLAICFTMACLNLGSSGTRKWRQKSALMILDKESNWPICRLSEQVK